MLEDINNHSLNIDHGEDINKFNIPSRLLITINKTIIKYNMFTLKDKIPVALSGGKDSTFALIALKQLGFDVMPVIIDLDQDPTWGQQLTSRLIAIGIEPIIIRVMDKEFQNNILPFDRDYINRELNILHRERTELEININPCTACFNIKVIALRAFLLSKGINLIVFGHHATDAISSLLKSALMYIDRWDRNHEKYDSKNFEQLITDLNMELHNGNASCTALYQRIKDLVRQRYAATDEPPVQIIHGSPVDYIFVRPLFEIFENDILRFHCGYSIEVEESLCRYKAKRNVTSPREMIQYQLVRRLGENQMEKRSLYKLLTMAKYGLTKKGTLIVNVRNERERFLGIGYRESGRKTS